MRRSKGFTLIELMIVVAVIGILAAAAFPKFADMLRKSKEGATKGGLTNLRSALKVYSADNEGNAPTLGLNGTQASVADLSVTLVPLYIEDVPRVKLGAYHAETTQIVVRSSVIVDRGVLAASYDLGGWLYTSMGGGQIFVNCVHTDTKNTWMTNW